VPASSKARPDLRLVANGKPSRGTGRDPERERPVALYALASDGDAITLAPLYRALAERDVFAQSVVSVSGDGCASKPALLHDLGLPAASAELRSTAEHPGERLAQLITQFERLILESPPGVAVIGGQGVPALAHALAATKHQVPVARVDAGLRSRQSAHTAELDRVLIDRLADTLYAASAEALQHLAEEGIDEAWVHHVGSTVSDAVCVHRRAARLRAAWRRSGFAAHDYVLVQVSGSRLLEPTAARDALVFALELLAARESVLLPLPPGARGALQAEGALERLAAAGVQSPEPRNFVDLLSMQCGARAIVTDDGVVQDLASALGTPCFTLSDATERTVTLTSGTNTLLGDDPAELAQADLGAAAATTPIPHWDGHTAERIADALVANYALVPGLADTGDAAGR
jgi:UDP-N-acetylglucosamine 2-epimerase (non-hydrolysing)